MLMFMKSFLFEARLTEREGGTMPLEV